MMSLDLMLQIVNGLDSKWQHPLADEFCALWGMDSAVYIRASANVIFRCQKGEFTYFLRFNSEDDKQWQQEIELLLYLRKHDYPCVHPIRSQSGKFIEYKDGCCAVMFNALPGEQKATETLTLQEYRKWGIALGKLHMLTVDYPAANLIKPWSAAFVDYEKYLTKPEMIAELEELLHWANSLPHGKGYGVIHADFEQDNLFWDGFDFPASLDYEDCIQMWYAADIAFALRDLYKEDDIDERLQAFKHGYKSVSEQAIDLFDKLPAFLRLHDFMQYISIKQALDIPAYIKKPEWMENLERKLMTEFLLKIEQHSMYKHY
jgi:Ser/Thr protein kinase RdoA (MazF antagonist)